ncbi:MAG TPA: M1 family metallopeptidase [Gemmatimonadales bacterium]
MLAGPVAAQTNAERILSEADTRSHDYDLVHQRIEAWGFDWDSLAFMGRVTTTAVSRRPGLDRIALDAGRMLEVRRVTQGRATLAFDRPGDSLIVRLQRPAGFGDTVRFVVEYRGRVAQGHGLYFFPAEPGRRGRQVYSGGGTDGNPNWFPTYAGPEDKETWDMIATVPADLTVVSNGRLVADRPTPGRTHAVHWVQERPASTYLVSLVAAPLVKLADRWRGVPLAYYVAPGDTARAGAVFRMTPDVLEVYARLTGEPFPWAKYAQVTVADYFGGMENVTATTMADWLPDRRAELDAPWYRKVLIPHEAAHNWFGNYVTTANWANYWLNEGFAQFMVGQYWRVKRGDAAAEDAYLADYRDYLEADGRRRMPLAALGSNNVYPKGSLVLRMLRLELGDRRFWAAIHGYLERNAFGSVTSADLARAVLDATGENLSWFFDQWVYAAGHPEFSVSAAYDSTARTLGLAVVQTQRDTLPADSTGLRYGVPEVFRGRVTIRVGTDYGDVVRELDLRQRAETLTVGPLSGVPTMVVFDDGNRLLKTLSFAQPTAWLATQLSRDPDPWNQAWAINQLGGRTADTAAGVALVRAASHLGDATTRALAAEALARFPAPVALLGLEAAVRDTSARVREAAVGALAGVGGPGALALARAAFAGDSSYAVRAAAVGAVAELDSAGAHDVIVTALATPSYRSVIQSAALGAAVRTDDAGTVPVLEERLGDQSLVALALAWFAQHGSDAAREALARHRDDERAWVRRWVAEAYRRSGLD